MKKLILFFAAVLMTANIFGQGNTWPIGTKPYFQGNVRVKDTLGTKMLIVHEGADIQVLDADSVFLRIAVALGIMIPDMSMVITPDSIICYEGEVMKYALTADINSTTLYSNIGDYTLSADSGYFDYVTANTLLVNNSLDINSLEIHPTIGTSGERSPAGHFDSLYVYDSAYVQRGYVDTLTVDSIYVRVLDASKLSVNALGAANKCVNNAFIANISGCEGMTVEFPTGVTIRDSLIFTEGAVDGYVLTSDNDGIASWQPTSTSTGLYTFDVTIPHDSILIMYTRPQELVPSPGANKLIVPVSIAAYYYYGGTAYATNTNVKLLIGTQNYVDAFAMTLVSTSSLINYGTKHFYGDGNNGPANYFNKNLNVSVSGGNPTDGTGANYIRIKGHYYIYDFN